MADMAFPELATQLNSAMQLKQTAREELTEYSSFHPVYDMLVSSELKKPWKRND